LGEVIQVARDAVLQNRKDAPAIDIKLTSRLPLMRGDQKRISQIIANLLSNAVKFTPGDGSISVKAYQGSDGSLLVEIADTGIGMAPDRIAIALEPFKQIDGRLARRFEGLGLGLPLANALVQLHGGRLAIASTPGKGTTVNIAFPPERVVSANISPVADTQVRTQDDQNSHHRRQ
jgi:signal transduction histidine kinase